MGMKSKGAAAERVTFRQGLHLAKMSCEAQGRDALDVIHKAEPAWMSCPSDQQIHFSMESRNSNTWYAKLLRKRVLNLLYM